NHYVYFKYKIRYTVYRKSYNMRKRPPMLLHGTVSCVKDLQGGSPHIDDRKVTNQNAARHSSGGYFLCSDSIATTKVANVTIKTNVSNTIIRLPPFNKRGEPPPMKALLH